MEKDKILLKVNNLKKYFQMEKRFSKGKTFIHAVDGITFEIERGKTLGLAGESGCGKTTVGRLILRLIEPDSGDIYFEKQNINNLTRKEMRKLRANMAIVFQDPQSSFNPRMTIDEVIGRPLEVYGIARGLEKKVKIEELLEKVEMSPEFIYRYPHELSGGQQQRVGIARALAVSPKFIVLDEPTSALDVSVQAQILNLLKELQITNDLTYLFISHNMTAVNFISHQIAIMYLGKIVEIGLTKKVFCSPQHPYTQALMNAIPIADPERKKQTRSIKGDVSSLFVEPIGCRFHNRCQFKGLICEQSEPELCDIGNKHFVACHFKKA